MIIDRESIRSLGFDSHGTDITIHWDNAAILWHDIYSTTNNVFALSQHNALFNSERKRMKRILNAKYSKADNKTIAESSTHLDPQERNELSAIFLISALEYLALRMRFILFVSALKGALCCDSASSSFAVEYMLRQRMAALSS